MKTPNPGSQEAQAQGCICAVIDNHYGEGFKIAPNEPNVFWITGSCPVHDKKRAKKIKIGSAPSYGESGIEDGDMSECYMVDLLNEQHKPIDNEEEQA